MSTEIQVPQLKREEVIKLLGENGVDVSTLMDKGHVMILAIRGYYQDTKGVPGQNDAGIYDDAFFLVSKKDFAAVRGNTDPSRVGWNAAIDKPFAMLVPGIWWFVRGEHKGYRPALRQPDEEQAKTFGAPDKGHFRVFRAKKMEDVFNNTARTEAGYFAINLHKGGDSETSTSSWGCLTLPPNQYLPWMAKVWEVSRASKQDLIPVCLINNPQKKA